MIAPQLKVCSWNINGNVIEKLPFLESALCCNDVLCLQEHFLSTSSVSLLKFSDNIQVFSVPAVASGRGRPSGGVAILVNSHLAVQLFSQNECFVAVKIGEAYVFSVYLPTDYRDIASEERFSVACSQLVRSVQDCHDKHGQVIVVGDFNCDLNDSNSARSQILLPALADMHPVPNDCCFTYVHNSGSTSSLDFFVCSNSVKSLSVSRVDTGLSVSDHFPITCSFEIAVPEISYPRKRKWYFKSEWNKVNPSAYSSVLDSVLAKIKIPVQLLQQNAKISVSEKQILLNIYCSELTHAMRCAETAAVPKRKVRVGSEVPKWSLNPELAHACESSKFWYRLWNSCGRPRSGAVNDVRLYTKRQFSKILTKHKRAVIDGYSERLSGNPNEIWKFISKKKGDCESSDQKIPSEQEWVKYYTSEFSPPDTVLEEDFSTQLVATLGDCDSGPSFTVSLEKIKQCILKLKKKLSCGIDQLCGMHLVHGSINLLHHLGLLFQTIFNCGLVPDVFCAGVVTPVVKKGKDKSKCSSYRPITVSSVMCKLLELIVIDEITEVCSTPENQFGFKNGYSREHVHRVIANVLVDVEEKDDILLMAGHDVSRAFDSGIHPQLLISAKDRGLDRSILRVYRNMYSKLYVVIKVPTRDGFAISKCVIRVWKGIRQGGISSPPLYNNSVLEAQKKVRTTFIYRGLDMSLLNYADDILNLSRTVSGIEENFDILCIEYRKIGLKFNAEKSEVVAFGKSRNRPSPNNVCLDGHPIPLSPSISYLGLPIGSDLRHTRSLLLEFVGSKLRKTYGMLVPCKARYKRSILSKIYNAFAMPLLLALSPFWSILTISDKKTLRTLFFRYAKFLLGIPLWARNRCLVSVYGVTDPFKAIAERRLRFEKSLDPTNTLFSAFM
jgi:exonuclease III